MAKFTLTIEGDTAIDGDLLKAIGQTSTISLSAMTHDSSAWMDRMVEVTLQEMRAKPTGTKPVEPEKPETKVKTEKAP